MACTKIKNTDLFLQKAQDFSKCQLLLLNNIKVFLLLKFTCKFTWKLYVHLYMQILSALKSPFHSSALLLKHLDSNQTNWLAKKGHLIVTYQSWKCYRILRHSFERAKLKFFLGKIWWYLWTSYWLDSFSSVISLW